MQHSRRFAGTTTLITGGSRGIGLAVAERLVAEGGKIILTARGAAGVAEAVDRLGGPEVSTGVPGKIDDVAHIEDLFQKSNVGGVNHLVNNIGINRAEEPSSPRDLGEEGSVLH